MLLILQWLFSVNMHKPRRKAALVFFCTEDVEMSGAQAIVSEVNCRDSEKSPHVSSPQGCAFIAGISHFPNSQTIASSKREKHASPPHLVLLLLLCRMWFLKCHWHLVTSLVTSRMTRDAPPAICSYNVVTFLALFSKWLYF